jgi:two-component system, LytTR family, response regulator
MPGAKLQCLIVDDEDLAVQLLQAYAQQHESLQVFAATTNATEVAGLLAGNTIDVLFLDIQMPLLNGLLLAEQLNDALMIVFTTAYANHAVDGFRLNAIDYLLKPFSYERFAQAVDKCLEYRHYKQLKQKEALPDCIYVRADGRMVKILLADILFIEGWKQYVKIYTTQKNILTLESMKNMEDNLPAGKFARVHKSYIAALDKVVEFAADELKINSHAIPVGKTYRDAIRQLFEK